MTKKTKMGKLHVPLDVRSKKDIPAFEDILKKGPMMIVLVYADWCGHCTKYKENVWSPLKSLKDRTMNMASVHYDQLPSTSLKNAKIDGYPSMLVVGQDKVPATFKSSSGTSTNAMPKSNDFTTMKNLVTSPVLKKEDEDVLLPNISNSLNKKNNISSSLNASTLSLGNAENINDSLENAINTKPMNNTKSMNANKSMNATTSMNANTSMNDSTMTKLSDTTKLETLEGEEEPSTFDSLPSSSSLSPSPSSTLEEETPPSISEDVVSLTNNTGSLSKNSPPPVAMMGGRLYRMLSLKNKRSKRKGTKKNRSSRR